MATLATLEGNVAGVLGLDFDASTPTTGDGPRLLGWANDAVIDLLLRTHVYIKSGTITLTAGTGDYDLQSTNPEILAIDDLYITSTGNTYPCRRMPTPELIRLRNAAGSSSPITRYALAGANLLMVFPTPLTADVLTVYYVPRPTALASGTDDPSSTSLGGIPSEYHYGLELYMMWKAAGFIDDESSQNGETFRRYYIGDPSAPPGTEARLGFVGSMKRDIRRKGGKELAGVTIPPRTRRIYVPNAGVDTGSLYYG